jgi:hypothetical protein
MNRILLFLLMCACATASAQVFKRTGPDGEVYFSDRPAQDARQVDVSPAQTISMPPVPEQTDTREPADGEVPDQQGNSGSLYTEFTIVSPTSEQGVRANDGNVTVHLSLQPELKPGHEIALKIDGEDGQETNTGNGMTIELSNLSRGRHTVVAIVMDDEGNEMIQAGPVSFNVLRVAVGAR